MIDHLSMICALSGSKSQIWMPGTFVLMAPNSPRYSMGASGLGSQVSCWLGPPRIQRMITDFCREILCPDAAAFASERRRSGNANPANPRKPDLRKLRRSKANSLRNSSQPTRFALALGLAVIWMLPLSSIADGSVSVNQYRSFALDGSASYAQLRFVAYSCRRVLKCPRQAPRILWLVIGVLAVASQHA